MAFAADCNPNFRRLVSATIVHHVDSDGSIYLTHGRSIVRLRNEERRVIGKFPRVFPRDLFQFSRLAQRAGRADKCNVYGNSTGKLLAIRASQVYRLDEDQRLAGIGAIQGDSVLHGSLCDDPQGWTYFGEYFRNPARGPVRIWRTSPDLRSLEVAYEFAAGRIRHVHGVYRDPFQPESLWATVGDLAGECYLVHTADRFRTIEYLGAGSQIWRAVKLFFTPTHVAWITDTNLEQNYACRMDRSTGELEVGQKFPCSGWYGFQDNQGGYIAATTVEPGPGILSDHSSLYVSTDAFGWHEIARFRKDSFRPWKLFKFGVVNFPTGHQTLDHFHFSGEGLCGLDGRVFQGSINKGALHAISRQTGPGPHSGHRKLVA